VRPDGCTSTSRSILNATCDWSPEGAARLTIIWSRTSSLRTRSKPDVVLHVSVRHFLRLVCRRYRLSYSGTKASSPDHLQMGHRRGSSNESDSRQNLRRSHRGPLRGGGVAWPRPWNSRSPSTPRCSDSRSPGGRRPGDHLGRLLPKMRLGTRSRLPARRPIRRHRGGGHGTHQHGGHRVRAGRRVKAALNDLLEGEPTPSRSPSSSPARPRGRCRSLRHHVDALHADVQERRGHEGMTAYLEKRRPRGCDTSRTTRRRRSDEHRDGFPRRECDDCLARAPCGGRVVMSQVHA